MAMEWFDRVCEELQDQLKSICEEYDEIGLMAIERAAKHPRIEFFVETADSETDEVDREYFCTVFFDPDHEEFYVEALDTDTGNISKLILSDIEDIVDEVHESLHDYLKDADDMDNPQSEDEIDGEKECYEAEQVNRDDIFDEIDVEWTTPEVTAFQQKDEVEITYQFGVVQETGDGVLKRINRIWTTDDELIKDESHFIFSKEEANTIIAMIASHMDQLSEFNFEQVSK